MDISALSQVTQQYYFGGGQNYIKLTLAGDNKFKTGDKVSVTFTTSSSGNSRGFYVRKTSHTTTTNQLTSETSSDTKATKTVTLTAAFNDETSIYINRNNGIYVFTVTITREASSLTKLATPSISINQATGVVTINDIDTHASKVTYTTNGSDPTASSTTYDAENKPVLNANCTVKAIAIGDGVSYSNSNITSANAVVAVENPVITSHNGTVEITCATDGATIKYNFDNGESWNTYTQSFTLFTGETVYAKAEKAGLKNNSSVVNSSVAAAPAKATGSQTKILSWIVPSDANNWEYMSGDNGNGGTTNYGIRGKADTEEEGWALWISPNGSSYYDKAIYGSGSYTISETGYTYLRGSNGRQFNIDMPANLRANRITLYSYNGMAGTSLWTPVCGTTYTSDSEIGIVSTSASSPEIRVFALDDVANTITLNNSGYQQLFIAVIDYTVYVPGPAAPETVLGDAITWDFSSSDAQEAAGSISTDTSNELTATDGTSKITYVAGKDSYETSSNKGYYIKTGGGSGSNRYFVLRISSNGLLGITSQSNNGEYVIKKAAESSTTYSSASNLTTITTTNDGEEVQGEIVYDKDKPYLIIGFSSKKYTQKITWTPASNDITLTTTDNMAGWRAFNPNGQGYKLDANTKAYIITAEKSDGRIALAELAARGGDIPGNTCVLLHTTSATDSHKMTLTKKAVANYSGATNKLKASTGALANVYRLGYGADGVAFYPYSGTPATGTVYLDVDSTPEAARALIFNFEEETTGISDVTGKTENVKSEYFDLSGRRVAHPTKGLYIVNGKKVIMK